MNIVKSKEFWIGAAVLAVVLKFGDKVPVAGAFVARAKAALA
jgi:hypothetical protein